MIVGGILMALTDEDVQAAAVYFFSRPSDTFAAIWNAVYGGYEALFRGADLQCAGRRLRGADPPAHRAPSASPHRSSPPASASRWRSASASSTSAAAVRSSSPARRRRSSTLQSRPADVPPLPLTLAAGIAGGAIWGGIVGVLKARTGAHEVILTIMLNYVAFYLVTWMVRSPALLQRPAGDQPISAPTPPNAQFPGSARSAVPPAGLGIHPRDRRDRVRVVARRALQPRLPAPRGRREPARGARAGHLGAAHVHLRDALRRWPCRPRRR